jgi:DNA mismatch repair protein MutS
MVRGPKLNMFGLESAGRPPVGGEAANGRSRYFSILFMDSDDRSGEDAIEIPEFFADLNCDKIVETITAGKDEYNLKPFFHWPLQRIEAIEYRQEVMRDLEESSLHDCILSFAVNMREMRERLARAGKAYYPEQKQAWFLDAADIYCDAINLFAAGLADLAPKSTGFLGFLDYLADYAHSGRFNTLVQQTKRLKALLSKIEYSVVIKAGGFTVLKYDGETDYSADVEKTFEKFQQGAAKDYRSKFAASVEMNHIEAKIAEFVSKLHPEIFSNLTDFCSHNQSFMDRDIVIFDREVQFYVTYLEYCAPLRRATLPFCYPRVSDTDKRVYGRNAFDIALARKLVADKRAIVCNDFSFKGSERILVVSGPNQGGKTTFARTFGQLHFLASIGCAVPGSEAQLFHFDRLFTHFEKQERVENIRGKLEDDLIRIHEILKRATPRSILVMNEIFTSTTIQDETFLSKKIMEKLVQLGALCVWVTFVDELASFGPQIASMSSTVMADNPAVRTFKVVRRPADGLAYAMAIAEKYRLTYGAIVGRISR